MYSRTYWAVLAVCLISIVLFFGIGCDEDSSDGGSQVSVKLKNFDASRMESWVVVCDATGEQVLEARVVPADGVLSFGDELSGRVTMSFILRETDYGYTRIDSYKDVTLQNWIIEIFTLPYPTVGDANVTLQYPNIEYTDLTVSVPLLTSHTSDVHPSPYLFSLYNGVPGLDNRKMSVLGVVKSDSAIYTGWILNQPFRTDTLNSYDLLLDQEVQRTSIDLSIPANSISYYGIRIGPDLPGFQLDREYDSIGRTHFELGVSDFPADYYWINVSNDEDRISYGRKCATFPSALEIPTHEVGGTFDSESSTFEGISFFGGADAVWASWGYEVDEETIVSWAVTASATSQSLSRPAIPDSLIQHLSFESVVPFPRYLGIIDYTPEEGWISYTQRVAANKQYRDVNLEEKYFRSKSFYDVSNPFRDQHNDEMLLIMNCDASFPRQLPQ